MNELLDHNSQEQLGATTFEAESQGGVEDSQSLQQPILQPAAEVQVQPDISAVAEAVVKPLVTPGAEQIPSESVHPKIIAFIEQAARTQAEKDLEDLAGAFHS